ncbi:hypothetical protein HPB48_020189 [Haemaphysalis longicornis]|uniref:Uncharacterized protein n=1 Tax=Haemaphysalis longicornis TaxID=44386 RepID=A0A9J6FJ85_HAELO|nr:hypothetical protein HPB48_020189 [Haemaphysalis longicornis]
MYWCQPEPRKVEFINGVDEPRSRERYGKELEHKRTLERTPDAKKKLPFALNFPKSSSRTLQLPAPRSPRRTHSLGTHPPPSRSSPPKATETNHASAARVPTTPSPVFTTRVNALGRVAAARSASPAARHQCQFFAPWRKEAEKMLARLTRSACAIESRRWLLQYWQEAITRRSGCGTWTTMRRYMHLGAGTDTDVAKATMSGWHKLGPSPRARLNRVKQWTGLSSASAKVKGDWVCVHFTTMTKIIVKFNA